MKAILFLAMTATIFATTAHASAPADQQVSRACLNEITKRIRPSAVALTGDRQATVSDQGEPLELQKGKTAAGADVYFKPLWKVVGNIDGFYHINAGAYITLTKTSCEVVGLKLEPDLF